MNAPLNPIHTIRASAWASLFDCPMRYYFTHILGMRTPSSGAAALGTAIHAGTACFDLANLNGSPVSIEDAVSASVDSLRNPTDEVAWDDDLSPREAEPLAITLTTRYCATVAQSHRYAAVELQCEELNVETDYGVIRLTGTTDRIRELPDGRLGICDLKSGKRATEKTADGGRRAVTKGHHIQLGIYTLLAEQASGRMLEAPAEIIGLQTTKEAPIATGEVADVKTALLGTENSPGLIQLAARMFKEGSFTPNPKSMMCSARYCAGYSRCHFHD